MHFDLRVVPDPLGLYGILPHELGHVNGFSTIYGYQSVDNGR